MNVNKIEQNCLLVNCKVCFHRWCGVTMESLGALIVFFAALFAVLGRGTSVNASTAGLSVTYALQVRNRNLSNSLEIFNKIV